ncbi:MAG TPA: aspartate aminotransferase family protein [Thermodesulfobacteriota bacterium]|nr:aspartate aminotransferase family protein [Thermodesulfobacteriota bacterium]
MDKMNDHVFYRNVKKSYPTVDRGEGVFIYDTQGKQYLDGSGGAAVVGIGHGVKEITETMIRQAGKIAFSHGSQFTSQTAIDLASQLVRLSPKGLTWVYYLSGGSEAIETAVKMARQYQVERGKPGKYKVISRWTSYHGNTLGALALSGHTGRRKHYLPLLQHTPHIVPAYCYRCPFGLEPEKCSLECALDLERTILYEGPESVSAFIAEPIVGATAGALVPRDGYFGRIREICDRYDVLLISDEVMTGMGRTGKTFGIDHWNVTPDMIVVGKGLSSGYTPIYTVIVKEEIYRTIKEGSGAFVHGHTYSQNPLSCAIASAVIDYLLKHDLISRSASMGEHLIRTLQSFRKYDFVGDVRGKGLFAGIEFVKDKNTKEPFDPQLKLNGRIATRAFEKGLITYPGGGGADGIKGDHLLLAPPLIITEEQVGRMASILDQTFAEISREI